MIYKEIPVARKYLVTLNNSEKLEYGNDGDKW